MYEEELRNLQNDLNQKDQKITQLEKEQKQLYKKYKSLKGKSKGIFDRPLLKIVLFWIFTHDRLISVGHFRLVLTFDTRRFTFGNLIQLQRNVHFEPRVGSDRPVSTWPGEEVVNSFTCIFRAWIGKYGNGVQRIRKSNWRFTDEWSWKGEAWGIENYFQV